MPCQHKHVVPFNNKQIMLCDYKHIMLYLK